MESLFRANPKQIEAWVTSAHKRFLLYGGAAGGGKSFFLRWWAVGYLISLAEQGIRRAPVGLFCEDYPSLADRQIVKIQAEFPPDLGRLRLGDMREFELADQWGGGRILLRNLDDPSKYLSSEFAGICVDELTRNELKIFNWLRLRLRWPGVSCPRFVGASNPGGKGHAWVKKYWIDHDFPSELQPLADQFAFVPAKASDNPFLPSSYAEDLKTLPADMAKAYAEGRWDLFVGQYFTNFYPDKHVCRAETLDLKSWWPRWVSIDWGYAHNAAVYWHAQDGERTITYRELVGNKMTPESLGKEIARLSHGERIEQVWLGTDAFANRTGEATIARQLGETLASGGLPQPYRADNDRVGGWMLMYQLLDAGQWVIADNCRELIACLPTLTRDDTNVEDIEKRDGDDQADAARYGLKSRLAPARKPFEERVRERVTATDPTMQAIQMQMAMLQERKAVMPVKFGRRWVGR